MSTRPVEDPPNDKSPETHEPRPEAEAEPPIWGMFR